MPSQQPGTPSADSADSVDDSPVAVLIRWEDAGAVWRVVGRTSGTVTVALMTCDGGEEVQRLTSADPGLLAFVDARTSNED